MGSPGLVRVLLVLLSYILTLRTENMLPRYV